MPKLVKCCREALVENDWYLWWDERNKVWHTGQVILDRDEAATPKELLLIITASGAYTEIGWVAENGYRIVHK